MYENVKEIRPGLFVQITNKKGKVYYQQVHPIYKDISKGFSFNNIMWNEDTIIQNDICSESLLSPTFDTFRRYRQNS